MANRKRPINRGGTRDPNAIDIRRPRPLPFQPWGGVTMRDIQLNNPEGIYWVNARDWENWEDGLVGDAHLILDGCCTCEYCPDC